MLSSARTPGYDLPIPSNARYCAIANPHFQTFSLFHFFHTGDALLYFYTNIIVFDAAIFIMANKNQWHII